MDSTKALVTQQLNSTVVAQLQAAAYAPWAKDTVRDAVSNFIQVADGHVIINPNSNQKLGTGTLCVFEHGAKQAIYAAFDLILGTYQNVAVGAYELWSDPDKAYDTTASLYMNVEGHGWTAFRRMDGKLVPIDLPETGDATEAMRLKYQWLDLVIKGAYIDINIEEYAPQLYSYFGSLMAMTPQEAITTIDAHVANRRERRIVWAASQSEPIETASEFVIDEKTYDVDTVKEMKKLFVTKGERFFSAGTSSPAELAHLTYLLQNGYTLSRTI
jgi:hypothetical protein